MHFKGISLLIVITVIVGGSLVVSAQQDMQNMPGMKMGNKGTQKKRTTTRKKPSARKHNMANMPGMNMPGMKMSGMHKHTRRKRPTARRRQPTTKH